MLYFLIAVMVLAWSCNFIVAKAALKELDPLTLLSLRLLFSNLILLALYFGTGRHRRRPIGESDWKWFALLGLFGIAGNQTGFTVGIAFTTVSHSALIISVTPVLVLLLAARMKLESFTKMKLFGMAISFAGVAILMSEHAIDARDPSFLGDLVTFAGSICFALYTVYSKPVAARYDVLSLTTFTYLFGGGFVFLFTGRQFAQVDWLAVSWKGWLGALYMAAAASVLAYLIFYYALTKISASRVIAFSYLQPVIVTVLGVLLLGDRVTPHLLGGGLLVLIGVVLAERGRT
ncbi:MAG TPA: DMT family transporter [Candidatus Xenobia bacterium]|nr:DMT family transporter [Candidatus Xenobia bacterium]